MRIITERPRVANAIRKLAWFVGLWLGGVLAVGAVAALLRLALHVP